MPGSLHFQILEQIQTEVRALSLTDMPDAHVVIQSVPNDKPPSWQGTPGVSITPLGQESLAASTAVADDIGYPVSLFVIDAAEQDPDTRLDKWLTWRETLFDHFTETRLGNVGGLVQTITKATFGTVIDPAAWQTRGLMVGRLNLIIGVRKPRRTSS